MFRVVLISPYELGRQPFALAEPAALLKQAGLRGRLHRSVAADARPDLLGQARLVAIYVGMHTATRIAVEALPRIRRLAPKAYVAVYGLYAPMNEDLLRSLGVGTVLGGETEPALVSLAERLRANGAGSAQTEPVIRGGKVEFVVPDRTGIAELSRYARLVLPDGTERVAGFAEASRGCKHLCRHCPIVPVYEGKFRAVPADVVIEDIRQQMALGATHISFGDPDFFNGPTHAMRIARALHEEFPKRRSTRRSRSSTSSSTRASARAAPPRVPVHHLRGRSGRRRDPASSREEPLGTDFDRAVALTRAAGIALAPTFVAFTPWTTLDGYIALLERILELQLIEAVPPGAALDPLARSPRLAPARAAGLRRKT
jgi:hypothetical protein